MREIECKITGKVQGVFFRVFVEEKARGFGLTGTVENLDDGSVRVVAQGEEENLKKLIEELHKGPEFAQIDDMHIEWRLPAQAGELEKKFQDFRIIY